MLRNLCILWALAVNLLAAQPYARSVEGIPVTVGSLLLEQPFTGGIDNPRHQFVDIDGDGDLDLFILDNDASMSYYENSGTAQSPHLLYRRNHVPLPQFAFWYFFVDLNSDGKPDLCTDDSASGVSYYVNTGSAQSPVFVLSAATMLDVSGSPIVGAPVGAPTFADLNGDSLLDYVSSNISGSFNYYENVGSRSVPLFGFVTEMFQNILILGDTCPSSVSESGPSPRPSTTNRHGGGNLQFSDIDANGTLDMFYGDLFSHGLFFMQNDGSPANPLIHCITNRFPDESMVTTGFNQPTLVDLDGDGTLDLFAGVLNFMPRHNFWFFKNTGTPAVANFQLQTRDALPSVDVGSSAHPAFVDIDANGTLDLVVGTLDGRLWFFANGGSAGNPEFTLADTAYAGISGNFTYAPVFTDIDHDADMDLFIGRFDGRIKFYRNTGGPVTPFFSPESFLTDTINVNRNASPAFVDIDADGDDDLFVGKANGSISFYRNAGNDTAFVPEFVTSTFSSVAVGEDAAPVFAFNPGRRCYDLFVGSADGKLFYYENDGDSAQPDFVLQTDHFADIDPLRECAPAFADLDADGDPDLFVGTSKGGIHYYRNDLLTGVADIRSQPHSLELSQNYPNPFNPATEMKFDVRQDNILSYTTLRVYDILGRTVATLVEGNLQPGTHTARWDAGAFPSGIYIARLISGKNISSRKLLLLK